MPSRLGTERGRVGLAILSIAGFGVLLVVIVMVLKLQQPKLIEITPTLTGQTERCLTCHNGIESISASHPTEEFGCVSCHGGNGLAVDETDAHTDVVVNPSSFDTAQQYCGNCHAGQVLMADRSIMKTYAGAIALIRRAFGLQPTGKAEYAAEAVGNLKTFDPAPTDPQPVHDFAANCMTCHTSG